MDKDLGEQKKAQPWPLKREKAMEAVDEETLELIYSEEPPFLKQLLKIKMLMKTRMMDPLKRRQEEEEVLRLILNGPAPPNAPFMKRT